MNIPPINKQVALAAKANRQKDQPSSFEEVYGAAWFTIDETNKIIGGLNEAVFALDKEQGEVVFLMLFNALSDVISAVYTLSSGWIRPSVTALRGALETIATATAIHEDSLKMARFVEGKLRVPDDIFGPAKQVFPSIGQLYGALTNQWTHEKFDTTARSIHEASSRLLLVPEMHPHNIFVYANVYVEAAVLAQMVGIGLETCFPNLAQDEVHFASGSDGRRVRCPAPSQEAIQIAVQARDCLPR